MQRFIALLAVLTTAACAHHAPFYGYGATFERAAAQCGAENGLGSNDTTRAPDGSIQMRCRRSGLTPQGKAVQALPVSMDAQAIAAHCQLIKAFTVEEKGDLAWRLDRALVNARNQTAAAGGNAVRVDSTVGNADSHRFFVRALNCTGLPG